MSHLHLRRLPRTDLVYGADWLHDPRYARELDRRARQSARSLSRRPARKSRARSQPGGNPTLKTFVVSTPSGPRNLRLSVGQFVTYAQAQENRETLRRCAPSNRVDFDALAKVPVEKIFAHCKA